MSKFPNKRTECQDSEYLYLRAKAIKSKLNLGLNWNDSGDKNLDADYSWVKVDILFFLEICSPYIHIEPEIKSFIDELVETFDENSHKIAASILKKIPIDIKKLNKDIESIIKNNK